MRKRGRPRKVKDEKPAAQSVKRIDVTIPAGLYEQIQSLVKEGLFFSMSDFGRTAIREKLAAVGSSKEK